VSTLITAQFPGAPNREIIGRSMLRDCSVEKEISSAGLCKLMGKKVGLLEVMYEPHHYFLIFELL
jgi:hypothetical protein